MSTIIIGDVAEGTMWWGVVEQLKRILVAQYSKINPFMSQWKPLSDTTTAFLQLVNGVPRAIIYTGSGFLYLDSGIMEFNIAIGNLDTYRPGVLHYTTRVTNDFSLPARVNGVITAADKMPVGVTKSILGRAEITPYAKGSLGIVSSGILDLERTNSYGNKFSLRSSESLPPVSDAGLPDTTTTFTGQANEFNTTSYLTKRILTLAFPASTLTGKAKLYLQALYGSSRNNFLPYLSSDQSLVGFYLPMSGQAVEGTTQPIIRPYDAGYNVWFITRERDGVISYAVVLMEFSKQAFRTWELSPDNVTSSTLLSAHGRVQALYDTEALLKAQAVILCSCTVKKQLQDWTNISGLPENFGEFPAYSWKFNDSGDKAVGVFYKITPTVDNPALVTATKISLNLGVAYNVDTGVESFSAGASAIKVNTVSTYATPIYAPVARGLKAQWYGLAKETFAVSTDYAWVNNDTAVVYAYFRGDAEEEITVSQDMAIRGVGSTSHTVTGAYFSGATEGVTYKISDVTYPAGLGGTLGVSAQGLSLSGLNASTTSTYTDTHTGRGIQADDTYRGVPLTQDWSLFNSVGIIAGGPTIYYDAADNPYQAGGAYIFRDRKVESSTGATTSATRYAVAIPTGDASSAVVYSNVVATTPTYTGTAYYSGPDDSYTRGNGPLATGIFLPNGGLGTPKPFDYVWGYDPGAETTLMSYPYVSPAAGTTASSGVYLLAANLSAGAQQLEDIAATAPLYADLMFPWRTNVGEIPTFKVLQSAKGAWYTYYGDIGAGTQNHEFNYQAAVGWA